MLSTVRTVPPRGAHFHFLLINDTAEDIGEAATPLLGEHQRPPRVATLEPAERDDAVGDRGTEGTVQVGSPLGPVEAVPGESPSVCAYFADIDPDLGEPFLPLVGHLVPAVTRLVGLLVLGLDEP